MKSEKGQTLVEMLVAASIGLGLLAVSCTLAISSKTFIRGDTVRTRLEQNARGALSSIGSDLRVGGQFLRSSFPAFELINGGNDHDKLVIRRKFIDETLTLCAPLTAGQSVSSLATSRDSGLIPTAGVPIFSAGCIYNGAELLHQALITELNAQAARGQPQEVYLYNPSLREGEFLGYNSISDDSTARNRDIIVVPKTLSFDYPVNSQILLLEELIYQLNDNEKTIDLVINRRSGANQVLHVAADILSLNSSIVLKDGVIRNEFGKFDSWKNIREINVKLFASEKMRWGSQSEISRLVSGDFFPRNVLSE